MAMSPLSSLLEGSWATPDAPTCQAASTVKQEVAGPITQKLSLYPPLSPGRSLTSMASACPSPPELHRQGLTGSSPLGPLHSPKKVASVKLQTPGG